MGDASLEGRAEKRFLPPWLRQGWFEEGARGGKACLALLRCRMEETDFPSAFAFESPDTR